jgi:hypothetical protein
MGRLVEGDVLRLGVENGLGELGLHDQPAAEPGIRPAVLRVDRPRRDVVDRDVVDGLGELRLGQDHADRDLAGLALRGLADHAQLVVAR